MKFPEPHYVETNGIRMAVYEQGPKDGVPIVMCHGFPELGYSWRHQLPAVAGAGFRALAPDQRGYGNTGGPKGSDAVPLYDIAHLTDDLAGMLDALGIDKAVFAGHDWGGMVTWQMALRHPDRVAGVIGVNTPFIPRGPIDPIAGMRMVFGEDMYIVYFQKFGVAEKIFDTDVARSMRFWYRKSAMKLADFDALPADQKNLSFLKSFDADESTWLGTQLLNKEELDYYTRAFKKSGFEGGINWYRNFTRNWQLTEGQTEKIDVPCLMISAADDIVLRPELTAGMENYIPDLEKHVIADCGHWTQSEKPDELNRLMVDWLKRRFS
ncbi:MAG: alpha/beta hydrolase [Parvibaculum sp.]|uniref:alpha/beta fold hydrolase n=1 Tax=Parvibaculum sp. TaxID=2024848 RepID=UPI002716A120|nr:alpha/beta hydrolase [Parvibaculum sp.]MDO8839786.1 alpha/beta hydrolase [Parvibaculum sp.]